MSEYVVFIEHDGTYKIRQISEIFNMNCRPIEDGELVYSLIAMNEISETESRGEKG